MNNVQFLLLIAAIYLAPLTPPAVGRLAGIASLIAVFFTWM